MADHPYVKSEMKRCFQEDGVVQLPQVLERDWIELVRLGIERNLRNPVPFKSMHYGGSPREFLDDYCNYHSIPEYRMLLHCSPIVEIVATILGTSPCSLY